MFIPFPLSQEHSTRKPVAELPEGRTLYVLNPPLGATVRVCLFFSALDTCSAMELRLSLGRVCQPLYRIPHCLSHSTHVSFVFRRC